MKARILGLFCAITSFAVRVFADIPAPRSTYADGEINWNFVGIGIVSVIVGALLFVRLGRKFMRGRK